MASSQLLAPPTCTLGLVLHSHIAHYVQGCQTGFSWGYRVCRRRTVS